MPLKRRKPVEPAKQPKKLGKPTGYERQMAKAHGITIAEFRRRSRERIFVPLPHGSGVVVDLPRSTSG
jgi:hypothetical protein